MSVLARVRKSRSHFQSNLYSWGSEFCPQLRGVRKARVDYRYNSVEESLVCDITIHMKAIEQYFHELFNFKTSHDRHDILQFLMDWFLR